MLVWKTYHCVLSLPNHFAGRIQHKFLKSDRVHVYCFHNFYLCRKTQYVPDATICVLFLDSKVFTFERSS